MDKIKTKSRAPLKRKLVQLYAALLYNCYARGFIKGDIYTGKAKIACVPGLNCYSCPGAIGACPLGALQNAIASSDKRMPSYVLGIILLYGLLLGRTICGWLCPMGLLQELCHLLPTPKLKKSNVTRALSYFKYALLFVLVIIIPRMYSYQSLPLPAFCKYICPAGTLEGALGLLAHPANADKFSMLGLLFTRKYIILVTILASCVFIYRAFCRFLCPLGAIYSLFSRVAVIGVKVDAPSCTKCGRCVSHCKMDVKRVGDHECIHCASCIDVCPTGAISFKAGSITLRANEGVRPAGENPPANKPSFRRWAIPAAMLAVLAGLFVYTNFFESVKADNSTVKNESIVPVYSADDTLPTGSEVGMRAADFSAPLIGKNGTFTLSDCLGKPVVINFWATWCTPCCLELPYFDRVYAENMCEIYMVAVHSNLVTDDPEAYLKDYSYSLPFAMDETGGIIASFNGSTILPRTVVIDKNGVITYNAVGSMTYDKLSGLVEEARGGRQSDTAD